jgi:hypothetical protein
MVRHTFLAAILTLVLGLPAAANTIGPASGQLPTGFLYSPSSSPFEAFDWTSLDFAAFAAYGGDFANVRRPAEQIFFFEDQYLTSATTGPEDEQHLLFLQAMPYVEELPAESPQFVYDEQPEASDALPSIPEPGIAMMVGIGLLGLSHRIRRSYRQG